MGASVPASSICGRRKHNRAVAPKRASVDVPEGLSRSTKMILFHGARRDCHAGFRNRPQTPGETSEASWNPIHSAG